MQSFITYSPIVSTSGMPEVLKFIYVIGFQEIVILNALGPDCGVVEKVGGVEYDFHNGHCGAAFDEVHGAKAILAWLVIVFREKVYLCAYIIT